MSLRFVNYGYGDGGRIEYGTVPHVGGERRYNIGGERRYNKSKDCRPPRREVPAGKGQRRRSLTNRCGTSIVTTCLILLCTVQGVRASHGGDEVLILNELASSPTLRQMIVEKDPYIAADGAVKRNAPPLYAVHWAACQYPAVVRPASRAALPQGPRKAHRPHASSVPPSRFASTEGNNIMPPETPTIPLGTSRSQINQVHHRKYNK